MAAEGHIAAEGIKEDFEYEPRYSDLEGLKSIQEYSRDKIITPGQYSQNTEVGHLGSQTFYVQDEESSGISVTGNLMAATILEELSFEEPDIFYDRENGKILVEEVSGVPSNQYRATSGWKMAKHFLGGDLEGDRKEVNRAIGLKYFLGDSDIPPNIVVTEETAAPIDFDKTGEQSNKPLKQAKAYAQEIYGHFNWEFSEDEFEETLRGMAEDVDLDNLEDKLYKVVREAPETQNQKDRYVRNSLENFRKFR